MAIECAAGLLGAIPFVGPVFSLAKWVIVGPLIGGLWWVYIYVNRGQRTGPSEVFVGFKKSFGNLFLGQLVTSLLASLCMLPALIVGLATLLPSIVGNREPDPVILILVCGVALICLIPMIFLQVNWVFTLALVIDKGLGFWPTMSASWKMVRKRWWQVFALRLVTILLNVLGLLACCVGGLLSMPLSIAALAEAYETIFGAQAHGENLPGKGG